MKKDEVERLVRGEHHEPHRLLGAHTEDGRVVLRAFRPDATAVVALVPEGSGEPQGGAPVNRDERVKLDQVHPAGLFEGTLDGTTPPASYRLEVTYASGSFTIDDPYRFWPTIGELDQYLLGEGRHERLWQKLGAHEMTVDGVAGTAFAVWAPNARAVRVVGDFNSWDGRLHPMRALGSSGIWELFVPGVAGGARYKYELVTPSGALTLKADPVAFAAEHPPKTASVVYTSGYTWGDDAWMADRERRDRDHRADVDLRDPPRLLAPRPVLPGAGRPAARLHRRPRLHPRGVHAGGRAPLRPVLGLPGVGLLRAHGPLRHPRRPALPDRQAAPAGHRGAGRLGAGALPQGRLRPGPLRRHRPLRARGPAPGRAPRLGLAGVQLRPQRGAQLPDRQRPVLAGGVPRRRPAGGRGRLHALPGLLAQRGRVGPQRVRRQRGPGRGPVPQGLQHRHLPGAPGGDDGGRGVDRLAERVPPGLPGRPRVRVQVEHGLDARQPPVHLQGPDLPPLPPPPAHLLAHLRLQRELHPAHQPRRGRPRQGLAAGQDARRRLAAVRQPARLPRLHVGPPGQAAAVHGLRAGPGGRVVA